MTADEDDASLLVILLETHRAFWTKLRGAENNQNAQDVGSSTLLNQLLVFLNSFQLLSEGNRVAIFGVHNQSSPLLYASRTLLPSLAAHCSPSHTATQGLIAALKMVAAQDKDVCGGELSMSAALSRALCFIHGSQQSSGVAATIREAPKPRILVLQASPDVSSQYIALMNAIFAAQRSNVAIDAAVLHEADSPFMQQAAFLTGGVYVQIKKPGAMLQYLQMLFCADTRCRSYLTAPDLSSVDFRASCFCHKRPVDVGYVCSVCLSIFCQHTAECSTCGTEFDGKPKHVAC